MEGPLPEKIFIDWLKLVGAYWFFNYQGDSTAPHALLTSGNHSNGFVDCLKLLKYPKPMRVIVEQLLYNISHHNIPSMVRDDASDPKVHWVVGSPLAGITLAFTMAERLSAGGIFTEKDPKLGKVMRRFNFTVGDKVLMVEELTSTLSTAEQQLAALRACDPTPEILEVFGVFFNRSGYTTLHGWPIISVINQPIANWSPDECPLCQEGSEAIRPKGENWQRLTGHAS